VGHPSVVLHRCVCSRGATVAVVVPICLTFPFTDGAALTTCAALLFAVLLASVQAKWYDTLAHAEVYVDVLKYFETAAELEECGIDDEGQCSRAHLLYEHARVPQALFHACSQWL
jgi:hypothetical protein